MDFFFFLTLQELITWKIPKVTQRLSGKVTMAEATKAPGLYPPHSCPFPGADLAWAAAYIPSRALWQLRERAPSGVSASRFYLLLSSVSVVGPWASPSKVSVLFYKVDTELLPSFPPEAAVKTQGESTVLCNDLPVRKNPFILHLLSTHFVSQADHNT